MRIYIAHKMLICYTQTLNNTTELKMNTDQNNEFDVSEIEEMVSSLKSCANRSAIEIRGEFLGELFNIRHKVRENPGFNWGDNREDISKTDVEKTKFSVDLLNNFFNCVNDLHTALACEFRRRIKEEPIKELKIKLLKKFEDSLKLKVTELTCEFKVFISTFNEEEAELKVSTDHKKKPSIKEMQARLDEIMKLRVYGEDGMWNLPDDLYKESWDLIVKLRPTLIDEDTFNLDNVDI